MLPFVLSSVLSLLPLTHAALYHPTPAISFLEHILVDNWGAYASNFSSAITPCTRYVSQTGTTALTSGRTTAAQWMRVMFHDFITANVSAGTGGIDASIGFEIAREENKGSAFNDSFAFWRSFVGEGVSSKFGAVAMPVKPVNVTYDFGADGKLMLSGKISTFVPAGTSLPRSLTFRINQHEIKLEPEVETGSSVFGRSSSDYGTTSYFPFSLSGPIIRNATSFSVYGLKVSEQAFRITSQVFVLPSLTMLRGSSFNVTIATSDSRSCDDLAVRIAAPFTQHGTLAPKLSETSLVVNKATSVLDGYTLCQGFAVLQDVPTGLVTVEALIRGQAVDTLLINGGMAGW